MFVNSRVIPLLENLQRLYIRLVTLRRVSCIAEYNINNTKSFITLSETENLLSESNRDHTDHRVFLFDMLFSVSGYHTVLH